MILNIKIKKINFRVVFKRVILVIISLIIAGAVPMQFIQIASAETIDEINARYASQKAVIQQTIDSYEAQAAILAAQAATLQITISVLQNQAAAIQAKIEISQNEYDQLIIQIADTEKKIVSTQDALGLTIANIYIESKITPLEMLASSQNVSDYLDKQEYRSSVRNELTSNITKIKDLKAQLSKQKTDLEIVLADQKNQRLDLENKQNEQQQLLAQTKGQEATYQQLTAESKAKIDELRTQQAAELAARPKGGYSSSDGDGSRGGYPLKWLYYPNGSDAPLNAFVDDWGMYSRQCVSYVAFRVDQAYGMPYWGGIGMAWQWGFDGWMSTNYWDGTYGMQVSSNYGGSKRWHTANTSTYGIPSGSVPKAGSVGVVNGEYGHVAWVESVNADGTINISHFNVGWGGNYSEWYNLNPAFFDTYIYFGER